MGEGPAAGSGGSIIKRPERRHFTVLIVEGASDQAHSIERLLRETKGSGVAGPSTVLRAGSLKEAMDRLAAGGIDLVLLDLNLPDSGGLPALKEVRSRFPETPVVVLSSHGRESLVAESLRAGAQDYLVKGWDAPEALACSVCLSVERQRAIAALRESEERCHKIVETAQEGIWILDADFKAAFVTPKMAELLGCAVREILGSPLCAYLDGESGRRAPALLDAARELGRKEFDLVFRKKDGSLLETMASASPMPFHKGRGGILLMVMDITERRDLETRFLQAQKLEAVGRLAGGVAHDFNNILTAILGYCQIIEMGMKPEDPRLADVREVIEASRRAASLTRQLLAFSRRQVLQPRVISLNSVISETKNMLRRLIGEDIELVVSLDPRLKNVKADPGQIEQVVMNLVVNSRDAMPNGGRLLIETANLSFSEDSPGRHDIIPVGSYVMLAVSDAGSGMSEEILVHIFEPFFTTKGPGKGTGLGLSTVYGIVKQSGGYIWVYSELGVGTTVKIYLPVSEKPVENLMKSPRPSRTPGGRETVLLAEDDSSVRRMLSRVLSRSGYTVVEAASGKEAIEILESRGAEIELVLTDVVMPEVGGRGLAEHVSRLHPRIQVIFMSGYTDDFILGSGQLKPGSVFLQKPITPDVLLERIRESMGAARSSPALKSAPSV